MTLKRICDRCGAEIGEEDKYGYLDLAWCMRECRLPKKDGCCEWKMELCEMCTDEVIGTLTSVPTARRVVHMTYQEYLDLKDREEKE